MMKQLRLASLIFTTMTIVLGCSSSPDEQLAERLAALEKAERDRIAEQKVFEQSQRKEELNVVPNWYLSPPEADGTGVFGVGYSRSKHVGHALKSARLQAEFELAKMFKQELSGSERSFERGNTDGDVVTQTTFLIDKIVDAVPVVGYTVVEQKMVPLNGTFETFVLLKLPYDEFNKVLKWLFLPNPQKCKIMTLKHHSGSVGSSNEEFQNFGSAYLDAIASISITGTVSLNSNLPIKLMCCQATGEISLSLAIAA